MEIRRFSPVFLGGRTVIKKRRKTASQKSVARTSLSFGDVRTRSAAKKWSIGSGGPRGGPRGGPQKCQNMAIFEGSDFRGKRQIRPSENANFRSNLVSSSKFGPQK